MPHAHAYQMVPHEGTEPTTEHDDMAVSQAASNAAAIGEMAALLGDTDAIMHLAGTLLTATAISLVIVTRLPFMAGVNGWGLVVLVAAAVCWITASALQGRAEQPVTSALGELRRRTGAPINASVPWVLGCVSRGATTGLGPDQILALITAANRRRSRARAALGWSMVAAGCFTLWAIGQLIAATAG
jgi:hypothetical protein